MTQTAKTSLVPKSFDSWRSEIYANFLRYQVKATKNGQNDLANVFKKIEPVFSNINHCYKNRCFSFAYTNSILAQEVREDDRIIIINETEYQFYEIRNHTFNALFSAFGGLYDNINYIINIVMGSKEQENISLPVTGSIADTFFSKKLNNMAHVIGPLKQRFGYPLGFLSTLRNIFLHKLEFTFDVSDIFESKSFCDGYRCTQKILLDIEQKAHDRYSIRNYYIDGFSVLEVGETDLLKIVERYLMHSDECVMRLLDAVVKSLENTLDLV